MARRTSRSQNKVLGIDIGGTGIKAAPVDINKGVDRDRCGWNILPGYLFTR